MGFWNKLFGRSKTPENCNDPHEAQMEARHLFEEDRYEKAEVWARRAIELAPNNSSTHMLMAQILLFQDKFEEALEEVDEAASFGHDSGDALFWQGRILYESQVPLSDPAEMRARLNKAIRYLSQSRQVLGPDKAVESYLQKARKHLELIDDIDR